MPITRKEFEDAHDPLGEQALAFLANNPKEAFTLQEIAFFLGISLRESRLALDLSLSNLVGLGKVVRQETGGGWYYAISLARDS